MMYGNPTITVNIGTNYSYTSAFVDGMSDDEKAASIYTVEGINFNPDYTMGISSDEANNNTEFLWCANIREDVALTDWTASYGATDNVPCTAKIDGHSYVYNADEDTYICSACNLHAVNYTSETENAKVALTTITSSGMSSESMGGMAGDQEISETTEAVSPEREAATTQSGDITITITPDEGYGLPTATVTAEGAEAPTEIELLLNEDGTYTGTYTKEAEGCLVFDVTLKQVVELTVTETEEAEVTVLTTVTNISEAPVVEETPEDETPEEEVAPAAEGDETEDGETEDDEVTEPVAYWSIAEGETKVVPMGDTLTIVVEPVAGFVVKNVNIATAGADGTTVTTTLPANETNEYTYEVTGGPITVSVVFDAVYTVTIPETENGAVTADVTEAKEGDTVTLTIAPADGYLPVAEEFYVYYEVEQAPAEGETEPVIEVVKVELTAGEEENTCTFVMPAADVTVHAEFTKIHTITVGNTITNGSVVADKESAIKGETITLTVTANEGYEVESVSMIVGDTTTEIVAVEGVYSFVMPDAEVVVNATFTEVVVEPTTYAVTVNAGENGTAVADKATAAEGETVTITVTPADGYTASATITIGGETGNLAIVDGVATFEMPAEPVTVTVTFTEEEVAPTTYAVTVNAGENGTAVADKATAAEGETVTITVTPADGYTASATITIGGETGDLAIVDGVATFEMPAEAVTVTVTFTEEVAPTTYTVTVNAGENGTAVASKAAAAEGETVTITVTPADGYTASATITIGGETGDLTIIDGVATFEMPAEAVTVSVTFAPAEPENNEG